MDRNYVRMQHIIDARLQFTVLHSIRKRGMSQIAVRTGIDIGLVIRQ